MSQEPNLDAILDFALQLAQRAGKEIALASKQRVASAGDGTGQDPGEKKNRVDLVTETDQAVEKLIKETIFTTFPSHKFIGEESYAGGERPDLTDDPTWIVDPIDGTTNFVHNFDHVCVSIGFTYKKIPTIGVIYNPFQEKLYHALLGKGAFLNQTTRLPLSYPSYLPLSGLGDALLAVEWGSDRSKKVMEMKTRSFINLAADGKEVPGAVMCHSLRSIGSAALNYSYVAAGQLDLYWEIGCWSWDVCAGVVIAREAGGRCFGRGGKELNAEALMGHHFLVIRGIADTATEKGPEIQERLAKEFFSKVEEWDA